MWFHKSFARRVGEVEGEELIELGTDAPPVTQADLRRDSAISVARYDLNGYPVQRLVVGYAAPDGSTAWPKATVYIFDEGTHIWFRSGPTQKLEPGALTFFDVPSLIETRGGERSTLEALVVVGDAEGASSGVYRFVIGADVSSPGL